MDSSIKHRLMILLIAIVAVVSCSNQPKYKVDFNKLNLSHVEVANKTNLMLASEQGNALLVKNAIEQGGLLNSEAPSGTAFSLALINKHYVIAQFLLRAGSKLNLGFKSGDASALMYAAGDAKNKILKSLIIKGADLDYEDKFGHSAISKAAEKGHLTTLKILINAGANVDVVPEGRSILMRVVEDNNMLLSQLLIAAGADVNFRDETGDTALKTARRLGYFDLDLMLIQSGARP